ncbi:MAG TPA: erythromycin esterase family protein [Pyrinomonadaceae bacterium]|nr:erythromycin esterase family protein [Pyrinomonadaceae bacterium]
MQRTLAILLAVCCLLGLASAQQNPDKPAVDWIAANAVRLKTPEAGNGFADMQPLNKIIGNARIVSLGEATHGTREFFQLKHRMLEFLATEMGFTIFSIEANMPEAYRLNDYVLNGEGDPAKLLKGMYFWTWDTQEVLAMIQWMREFNKSGKGRVQFTGFDMQTPDVAGVIVRDFVTKNDTTYLADLRKATELIKVTQQNQGPAFGVATARFPIEAAAGKRVHYSGYIKTKDITRGWAGLWWRVDGKMGVLAFDNMEDRGARGTTDWKRYEIDLPVAADVTNINFGALHTGDGSAWFDGLEVTLDGKPYPDKANFDLDFESSTPAGFYTGGNGYQVTLDKSSFQSGSQSLMMTHVGTPADASKKVDPKESITAWRGVIGHLEDSRNSYAQKGIAASELDWVIQNARVVLQCIQMNANEVQRDVSMAQNIKWILDQNPNAKIVLWAHNGHVAKDFVWRYKTMGSALREMFGEQMVVFGFAFYQGSFQAIERGKGLRDFTVSPAPAGSLDATLAATGIPLLAIDLRKIPKASPVGTWWSEPHKSRNIGAMYATDMDNQFLIDMKAPESFDVLLFVEKTTAARKNPAN